MGKKKMHKSVCLCLFALVALAAAGGMRCKMPQQWEARRVSFDPNERYYHNHTSEYYDIGRYSYDGEGMRKRLLMDATFGNNPDIHLLILELYHEKNAYVLDLDTKKCKKFKITWEWHAHDIPLHAHFLGYETLGTWPSQLELAQFRSELDGMFQFQTFTKDGCVPVRDDVYSNATG